MADDLTGLARAISVAGGQLPLAKLIGTSQSNVWEWLNKSRRGVPAEWVLPIEAATGVPRHELRPDLYPPHSVTGNLASPSEPEAA